VADVQAAAAAATPVAGTPLVNVPAEPASAPIAVTPIAPTPISVKARVETIPTPAAKVEKRLFWSAALNAAEEPAASVADQSHVPPILRDLKKCEACGFPVSAGRTLCVECEEKKWRGKLKPRASTVAAQSAAAAAAPAREAVPPEAVSPMEKVLVQKDESQAIPQAAPAVDFVLTARLQPSQSWFARNKYVIGVIVVAVAVITGLALLR
jgi:hypothetical protein